MTKPYKPHGKNKAILARAQEHVQSVPYTVTLRWLFYRLLQEGVLSGKSDYSGFKTILSAARKRFYEGWRPDILADDTRVSIIRGDGFRTTESWTKAIPKLAACTLDKWGGQSYYVELWFEAKAMRSQFEHYTRHITLRPFGGDPSIPYKWAIAKDLEWLARFHAKAQFEAMIVLYFGDLDAKGESIPTSALTDIREWCDVDFEFVRAGLNPGDETRFGLPENFEHPGAYQWEALGDDDAEELITSTIGQYVDYAQMDEIEKLESAATKSLKEHMKDWTP